MRKVFCFLLVFSANSKSIFSQEISRDSTLDEIIIQAYTADRPPEQVPASIGYLNRDDLNRFSNTSMLPAANTIPGVRMEERSPGSYRFSIRGSTIRSPFGVRNVKVYWNGIPFTDAGGNTYLNLVHADFDNDGDDDLYVVNGMNEYAVYSSVNPYLTDAAGKPSNAILPVAEKEVPVFFVNTGGMLQEETARSGADPAGNAPNPTT